MVIKAKIVMAITSLLISPPRGTPDATLRQGEPASFTKRSIHVYTNNIDHAHHTTFASRCHHLSCRYLEDGNRNNLSSTAHFPFERGGFAL